MKIAFDPQKARTVWNSLKPWVIMITLFLVLRYTGILSGITYLTGRALLQTGLMNANTDEQAVAKSFDYNFKIKALDGTVIDFKTFKGKTIFLNMWATWCGPCRFEMPSIQKLYNSVDREKIVFIMLSIDEKKSFDKVVSFVKEKEYTFPVYTPNDYLPEQLQVGTIPTTFVISPDGKIAAKEVGAANYDTEEFRKFLEEVGLKGGER